MRTKTNYYAQGESGNSTCYADSLNRGILKLTQAQQAACFQSQCSERNTDHTQDRRLHCSTNAVHLVKMEELSGLALC